MHGEALTLAYGDMQGQCCEAPHAPVALSRHA